jgi:hypothetical protein
VPWATCVLLFLCFAVLSCSAAPPQEWDAAADQFDRLLNGGAPSDLVAELRDRIRFKEDTFFLLTAPDQLLVRVDRFRSLYGSGRLRAWFEAGTYGPDVSRDFRDIGCPSIASAIEDAFGLGSGADLKAIEESVRRTLEARPDETERLQHMIDAEFESIDRKLAEHVRAHVSDYIHLRIRE